MQDILEKHSQSGQGQAIERLLANFPQVLYTARVADSVQCDFFNARVSDLTGYGVEELLAENGGGWVDLIHQEDRERYIKAIKQCVETAEPVEVHYRIVANDGDVRDVVDRARAVDDGYGDGVVGVITEVTNDKRAQRELERTELLQNLGRLVAGIAHEINTPIQFIGDNLRFLSDSYEQVFGLLGLYSELSECLAKEDLRGKPWRGQLEKILGAEVNADIDFMTREIPDAAAQSIEGARRVAAIVAAMRDFSHIDERRMGAADLNKALKTTMVLARNELKYVADLKTDLDESLPVVMCCIDDINQVFLNLLINAAHSIEEAVGGGSDKRGLITVTSRLDGDEVVISFADTGTGIPDEVRKRMFEPFFTTKSAGRKGTGQGLSAARRIIVDKHKGKLDYETIPGRGTMFTVRLPVCGVGRDKK